MYESQPEQTPRPELHPSSATDHQQHLSRSANTHPGQLSPGSSAALERKEDAQILQQYGVTRTVDHDMVQYRLPGSDNKLLFEAHTSAQEFSQSSKALETMTQVEITSLQSTYHVSFGKNNEPVVRPYVVNPHDAKNYMKGPMLYAREPRLSELMGVDAALRSSQPSELTDNGTLKYYFLKTPSEGKDTYDAALYAADLHNKASVMFEPDAEPDRPITVADAIAAHQDIKTSVEALAAHEMAHNTELKLGLLDPEQMKPVADKLGWTITYDANKNPEYWLLKGKDGDFYRLTSDGLSTDNGWIRCNGAGQAIDQSGNVVAKESAAPHLTNAAVRERALVRPPTDYFTQPDEELADSLMLYRVGEPGQKQLHDSGDQLFDAVKQVDQDEINLKFGKNADGSPKMVRSADGTLTPVKD